MNAFPQKLPQAALPSSRLPFGDFIRRYSRKTRPECASGTAHLPYSKADSASIFNPPNCSFCASPRIEQERFLQMASLQPGSEPSLPPPPHPLASYKAILIIYPEDSVVNPVKQPFHNHLPSPPQKHTPPSWQVAKSALRGKGSHKDHQERRR